MLHIIKPPIRQEIVGFSIFLGGSIEMGKAEDWQAKTTLRIKPLADKKDITLLNPRRNAWNKKWKQSIHNRNFANQVHWELDHIEQANLVLLNFCEDTLSPISLLELGKCSELKPKQTIACAPKSFWRRGNIEIVASRGGIRLYEKLDDMIQDVLTRLRKLKA